MSHELHTDGTDESGEHPTDDTTGHSTGRSNDHPTGGDDFGGDGRA